MSATRNEEAAINSQAGEFRSKVARDEPLTTHGHKPGVLASESDKAPEFQAKTLPAGTAPPESTFKPNNISEVPPTRPEGADPESEQTSASDTIVGATSGDVHTGLGQPVQGQSSKELHHDGGSSRGAGLEGVGASQVPAANKVDGHDPAFAESQRAIDREEAKIGRGNVGGPAAEDRVPETADSVASSAPSGR